MVRHAIDGSRRDEFHHCAWAVPALAVLLDGSSWLGITLVSVVGVVVLGIFSSALLYVGRRFRWLDRSEAIQFKRTLRVAFGGLFLASVTLPYLVVQVPMVAASFVVFALLLSVPYLLSDEPPVADTERSTGEHPEVKR